MKQYSCKNCGAVLYWNPTTSSLECEYCLMKFKVSDFDNEPDIENETPQKEREYEPEAVTDENIKASDESESADLVMYKCSKCNAEVVTARSTIATTCAFCGEAISITNKIVDNFKPDCVVPFKITKEKAMEAYKEYAKKGVLTPKDFNQKNAIEKMKGMYAPFWLHSFTDNVDATVYGEHVSSSRRGYDKVNTHKMYEIDIDATGRFDNIPADALKSIDNKLMDSVEPYDYSNLEKFSPAYMAGYYAEEYGEDAEETFKRAEKRANDAMAQKVLDHVTGYTSERMQSFRGDIDNADAKYTMLPVWLFHTKYDGKDYLYAVNGQTGKVAGDLPICNKILFKYAGIAFFGSQILMLLYRLFMAL